MSCLSFLSPIFSFICSVLILKPYLLISHYISPSFPTTTYEEWRAFQDDLDELHSTKEWARNDVDRSYRYQNLRDFKVELEMDRRSGNMRGLCTHLRYQSWSRNICNILAPSLYQKSRIRTKKLILDYLREVRRCIEMVTAEDMTNHVVKVSKQEKKDLLRDMQSSLGKTTLLLQGGALVSMCHLGVVKALHEHGLLPRIITGTSTGALIAALIGSVSPKELGDVLRENRIDLGAFARSRVSRDPSQSTIWPFPRWWRAFLRRARRLARTGHFFDISVLADCAKDNLGDVTFEEAFQKSGLVLNITIAMPEVAGTPVLLNYITAPHVLVWSAVAASVATSKKLYAPAHLYCKDDVGQIKRYYAVDATEVRSARAVVHPASALERMGELFNVNHFIISQTRPYVIPFTKAQEAADEWPLIGTVTRLVFSEIVHWLSIAKWFGILPNFFQRIMIDETLPNSESWSKVVLSPDLSFRDFFAVFDLPNPQKIKRFATQGERSVWTKLCQLHVRCSTELEVDAAMRTYSRSTEEPAQ